MVANYYTAKASLVLVFSITGAKLIIDCNQSYFGGFSDTGAVVGLREFNVSVRASDLHFCKLCSYEIKRGCNKTCIPSAAGIIGGKLHSIVWGVVNWVFSWISMRLKHDQKHGSHCQHRYARLQRRTLS